MIKEANMIKVKDAIAFIVHHVYAEDYPTPAKKRVRQRIMDAAKNGLLVIHKPNTSPALDATEFFGWAITKWPELTDLDGLPLPAINGVGETTLKVPVVDGICINAPINPDELLQRFIESETARIQHEIEKPALLEAVEERDLWRNKDAETRRKKSEAGKLARGVPKK